MKNDQGMRDDGALPGEGDTEEDREIRKSYPRWSSMSEAEKVAAMQTVDEGWFPKHNDREWYIGRNGTLGWVWRIRHASAVRSLRKFRTSVLRDTWPVCHNANQPGCHKETGARRL